MTLAALALTILACACLYLVSPNQRWRAQPLPMAPFLALGIVLLIAGTWLWTTALQPLAGFCMAAHVVMACLFAFPYIAVLKNGPHAPPLRGSLPPEGAAFSSWGGPAMKKKRG